MTTKQYLDSIGVLGSIRPDSRFVYRAGETPKRGDRVVPALSVAGRDELVIVGYHAHDARDNRVIVRSIAVG